MNRYAVDVSRARDRASATSESREQPAAAEVYRVARRERAPREKASLRDEQLWFARAVMSAQSEGAAFLDDAVDRLTPGPRLSAPGRLGIYQRAYVARLVECLVDDYPVLQHALGEDAFDGLCRAYIEAHPSSGPSLNFFGRHMARFCQEEAASPFPERAFAVDLATLEWAIVEVIHAPGSEPLTVDGLREVPMDAWAGARLVANTASRLIQFRYPVNAYFQSFRTDGDPSIPEATPSATIVYRSGASLWRMDLTVPMYHVLSALLGGETLEVALVRGHDALGDTDEARAGQLVLAWFREWVASGFFAFVEF